jgi:undecaprenyl-diphosphatase
MPPARAATATVLSLVFWPVLSRTGRWVLVMLAVVAAAVIGYTRIALGVHFVSDVVAGWCVRRRMGAPASRRGRGLAGTARRPVRENGRAAVGSGR